jgi:hypothetical protein
MRDFAIGVVRVLDQFDPRNFLSVVKLIKMLKEEGSVLASEINDTKSTFFLWFVTLFSRLPTISSLHYCQTLSKDNVVWLCQ